MITKNKKYLDALGINIFLSRYPVIFGQKQLSHNNTLLYDKENYIFNMNWEELNEIVLKCTDCELCKTRNNVVFGKGNNKSNWVLVGEAPGVEEDLSGLPFVGKAGSLLDKMLNTIDLNKNQVFITNTVKCRPPNNRNPSNLEILKCLPFLKRQIMLIKPVAILALGKVAAQSLLNTNKSVNDLRGNIYNFGTNILLIVTYHPAYLLRSPKEKRKSWDDLKIVKKLLNS